LGERSSAHYGPLDLGGLEAFIVEAAERRGWRCVCYQTNHEGEFVELVHQYRREAQAFIVNPGAWSHYSYAIRDALEVVSGPVAEVHLSDIMAREPWRRRSVLEEVAAVRVWGKGPAGYEQAMDELTRLLEVESK
jgi:3-dehydroquinate dehydratase-2